MTATRRRILNSNNFQLITNDNKCTEYKMTINALNIIKALNPRFWVGGVMCRFGFHDWEITKWCIFKDSKCKYLLEEGFNRTCQRCDKEQTLKRPEKYHPSKYVWTDSNSI